MEVLYAEGTPNPNAVKFVLDGRIIGAGSRHFDRPPAEEEDPLAAGLFTVPGVLSVFYNDNFVTITTESEPDWRLLQARLEELVADREAAEPEAVSKDEGSDAGDLLSKINAVIDTYVRPALAGDGGGLQVLGLEGEDLFIRYEGACGTCPSAISGTLFAIQNLLRNELGREINVLPG